MIEDILPARMKDIDQLLVGLSVLSNYDTVEGSRVQVDDTGKIYAGPTDEWAYDNMSQCDRDLMLRCGWEFSDDIGRWGW